MCAHRNATKVCAEFLKLWVVDRCRYLQHKVRPTIYRHRVYEGTHNQRQWFELTGCWRTDIWEPETTECVALQRTSYVHIEGAAVTQTQTNNEII